MAIFDALFEFLDNQTFTTSDGTTLAATCKTLDFVNSGLEMGAGEPIWLNIKVGTTAITGGTSVDFRLLSDTTAGGQDSGSKIVMSSGARVVADLTVGAWVLRAPLPYDVDRARYLGVVMVAVGTCTGKVDAWLDHGPQSSYDTQVTTSNIS